VPRAHLSAALKTFRVLRQLIASIYRIGRFTGMSENITGSTSVRGPAEPAVLNDPMAAGLPDPVS
jgi:hypothetical protein